VLHHRRRHHHARYARDDTSDIGQKNVATSLLAALGASVLYRHVDIKISYAHHAPLSTAAYRCLMKAVRAVGIRHVDYFSKGRYLVKAVVYSLATGLPFYFCFEQTWLGDSENLDPDQFLTWGGSLLSLCVRACVRA
jgi:hypothetical protein